MGFKKNFSGEYTGLLGCAPEGSSEKKVRSFQRVKKAEMKIKQRM